MEKPPTAIQVFDYEVSTHNDIGSNKGSPYSEKNFPVCIGYKWVYHPAQDEEASTVVNRSGKGLKIPAVLVGHNLPFDLAWRSRTNGISPRTFFNDGCRLWDTQLADYLLSGQTSKTISLDALSEKHGLPLKDDRIKEYWDAGKSTEDIPKHLLEEYCKQDVDNTAEIFKKQVRQAHEESMMRLIVSQNMALMATTEMQFNGMHIDIDMLKHVKGEYEKLRDISAVEFYDAVKKGCPEFFEELGEKFNPSSVKHLSTLFFGGSVEYKEKEQVGIYKNGKPKYKTVLKSRYIKGFNLSPIALGAESHGSLKDVYSTGVDVLQDIERAYPYSHNGRAAKYLLQYREADKQLNTFVKQLDELRFPGNFIHPNYNHTVTSTGRLSSSNPNLQNQTDGIIKKCFDSRWGDDGVIINVDYSQLEIVALAVLTQDEQLLDDILTGRDMHIELYKTMYGREPTKDERKAFKRLSFGLIYGAGVNTLSDNAGIPKKEAKKFVETFYDRYKGVKDYHDMMQELAKSGRVNSGKHDAESGMPYGIYEHRMPTGRKYVFREYYGDDYRGGKRMSFSPTELKNYTVQGFATGDVVPHMVGVLAKELWSSESLRDDCLLINTVHDSIMFDCKQDKVSEAAQLIVTVLRNTPQYIKDDLGFDMYPITKLDVQLEYGPNWYDVEECDMSVFS